MRQFKVYWLESKVWVNIVNGEDEIDMLYKDYEKICRKHNLDLMRDIHDEIEHYVINDSFQERSHVKILHQDAPMSLSFFQIKPLLADQAIQNITIFLKELAVDEETPLLRTSGGSGSSGSSGCGCTPRCTIN